MLYPIALILSALIIAAASFIFIFKDTLHIALALSAVFFVNSLIFLFINQPLLALIQLFIMVGGVSIYLFVGVASASYSHFRYTNYALLTVAFIAIFIVMVYGVYSTGAVSGPQSQAPNTYGLGQIASSFGSTYSIMALYAITIMLFLLALGSIPLLNRLKVA